MKFAKDIGRFYICLMGFNLTFMPFLQTTVIKIFAECDQQTF